MSKHRQEAVYLSIELYATAVVA